METSGTGARNPGARKVIVRHAWILAGIWTLLVAMSLAWGWSRISDGIQEFEQPAQQLDLSLWHLFLWLMGLLGLVWLKARLIRISRAAEAERMEAAARLRESDDQFRAIFEHARDGILVANAADGTFVQANSVICAMLGYSRDDLLGRSVTEIHPPDQLPMIREAFERQTRVEFLGATNLQMLRKDSTIFFAEVSSSPVTIQDRQCSIGMFRDITERRLAEEALRAAEAQGRHLQKLQAVGTLASGVRTTVEDQGGGIPPEVADRIFDPFFSTKPRHAGTGLGLSISHGIVQEHHGRLSFEDVPGGGTRFFLDLPVGHDNLA